MRKSIGTVLSLIGGLLWLVLAAPESAAQETDDRHAGYYYPPPQSSEVYTARVTVLPDSDRNRRIGFVTAFTKQLITGNYAPSYVMFAKGDQAEKLIIVGLEGGQIDTLYRARALLAQMTAIARVTPFFQQNTIEEQATFLDLLKLLGFEVVTVSDGGAFAHQIKIQ